jgi:hypothetical protein
MQRSQLQRKRALYAAEADVSGRLTTIWPMKTATVTEVVSWAVMRRSGWRGVASWCVEVIAALGQARYGGWSKARNDVRIPGDTKTPLDLDPPLIRGRATWLPRYPPASGGWFSLTLYRDRATIDVPQRFETVEHDVPLRDLEVVGSRLLKGRLFPKCASARWELVLARGDDRLTVEAAWLTLAWMGQLAGWPEP